MRTIAINGSARKDGNTTNLINVVFKELKKEEIETMKVLGQNMVWLMKKILIAR